MEEAIDPKLKYDKEFITWLGKKYETEGIKKITDGLKSDRTELQKEALKTLEENWGKYIDELLEGLDEVLLSEYGVPPEDFNEDLDYFWEYYREKNESDMIKTVRNLYEGAGTVEGVAAFEYAKTLYMEADFQKDLALEKLKRDPSTWLTNVLYNTLTEKERGVEPDNMWIKSKLESGLVLSIVESTAELNFDGESWVLSVPQYPNLIKAGEAKYATPEEALVDARKLLREVVFVDSVLKDLEDKTPNDKYKNKPIRISSNGENIEFTDDSWWTPFDYTKGWETRGGKYQANHLLDIHSVVRTLNSAYLEKNGYAEVLPEWSNEEGKAKEHFEKVKELVNERGLDLNLTPNQTFNEVTVSNKDGESLKIERFGDTWRISSKFPELFNPNDLDFKNPVTGLIDAISTSKTILYREHELNEAYEAVKEIENPESLFTLGEENQIQFNGKYVRINGRIDPVFRSSSTYDLNLISKVKFVDALNAHFIRNKSGLERGSVLSSEQTLQSEGWKVNHNEDLDETTSGHDYKHKWKSEYPAEITGDTIKVKLDDKNELVISQINDRWHVEVPERYRPLVKEGTQVDFLSFGDSVEAFENLMPMITKGIQVLDRIENLELNPKSLEKNKTPFYLSNSFTFGEGVSFSDESNTRVLDTRYIPMTGYFDLRSFVNGLNEIYLSEQGIQVDEAAPDEVEVKTEINNLISHVKTFSDKEWAEVLELAKDVPSSVEYSGYTKEMYISLLKEQSTLPQSWGENGLYHLIVKVKPLSSSDEVNDEASQWTSLVERGEITEGTLEFEKDGTKITIDLDEALLIVGEKKAKLKLLGGAAKLASIQAHEDGSITMTGVLGPKSQSKTFNALDFAAVLAEVTAKDVGQKIKLEEDENAVLEIIE